MNGCDPTLPVNDECCRQRKYSSVKFRQLVITYRRAIVHLVRLYEGLNCLPAIVIHRDAQHGKTAVPIHLLELDEPRNLDLAGTAPSGPEIEKYDPTLEIG